MNSTTLLRGPTRDDLSYQEMLEWQQKSGLSLNSSHIRFKTSYENGSCAKLRPYAHFGWGDNHLRYFSDLIKISKKTETSELFIRHLERDCLPPFRSEQELLGVALEYLRALKGKLPDFFTWEKEQNLSSIIPCEDTTFLDSTLITPASVLPSATVLFSEPILPTVLAPIPVFVSAPVPLIVPVSFSVSAEENFSDATLTLNKGSTSEDSEEGSAALSNLSSDNSAHEQDDPTFSPVSTDSDSNYEIDGAASVTPDESVYWDSDTDSESGDCTLVLSEDEDMDFELLDEDDDIPESDRERGRVDLKGESINTEEDRIRYEEDLLSPDLPSDPLWKKELRADYKRLHPEATLTTNNGSTSKCVLKLHASRFARFVGAPVELGILAGGVKRKKKFVRRKGRRGKAKHSGKGRRTAPGIGGIPLHVVLRLEEMVKGLMTNVGANDCSINFGLTVLGGTSLLTTTPMTQFLGETQLPNLYTKARVEGISVRISWNNSETFPMAVYAYITNVPPTNNAAVNYLEAHEKLKGRLSRVYKFVLEHSGLRAASGSFSFSVSPKRIYGNPTQYQADSNTMIAITPNLGGVPTYAAPSNNVFLVLGAQTHLTANVFTAAGVRFNCTMIKRVHMWEKVPQIQ